MSITIRLTRTGRANLPSYRIVVANTKDKRDGKFLDVLGFFNPSDKTSKATFDKEKFEHWKKNGALVSDAVQKIADGKYEYTPYNKGKVAEAEETK
jgi:small subunit ribosomal protein S16